MLKLWSKTFETDLILSQIEKNYSREVENSFTIIQAADNTKDFYGSFNKNQFNAHRKNIFRGIDFPSLECEIKELPEGCKLTANIGYSWLKIVFAIAFLAIVAVSNPILSLLFFVAILTSLIATWGSAIRFYENLIEGISN